MAKVFVSYCHHDESLRNELEVHLAMLKRQGVVDVWHDRRIDVGTDIDSEISRHLEDAEIILLLVSPHFLASDYCYDVEMKRAMERHVEGEARVVPVILQPCDWHAAPFGKLLATPKDGKPVAEFPNTNSAFLDVVRSIRNAVPTAPHGAAVTKTDTASVARKDEVRSANLRTKRPFSRLEREEHLRETFEYICLFFTNSCHELEQRNSHISTACRRAAENGFTAEIYLSGDPASSCCFEVCGGHFAGDEKHIRVAFGATSLDRGYNDEVSVVDDGYSMTLRRMLMPMSGSELRPLSDAGEEDTLSMHGISEAWWSHMVQSLQ